MALVARKLVELNLGYGIGLRRTHYDEVLRRSSEQLPDWFEIVSENFMNYGGRPEKLLTHIREQKIEIIPHGVGLSLGSLDKFNTDYIEKLKSLISEIKPKYFSDHLCFSSTKMHQYHDLLPILKTKQSLNEITDRVKWIEDIFQLPFAFENITYYGESSHNTISEIDFINLLLDRTESFLLLDINNIYVNSINLNFDANEFLDSINLSKVLQIHLAGHEKRGDFLIDTHGAEIPDGVWDLYEHFIKLMNKEVSVLIEWDNSVPSFEKLMSEAQKAKVIAKGALGG